MTLIIGVQCSDGNLIIADGRTMQGDFILSDNESKIKLINHILIAGSGDAEAIQYINSQVKTVQADGYEGACQITAIIQKAISDYPKNFEFGSYLFSLGNNDLYYQRNSAEQKLPYRIERAFAAGVGYLLAQYFLNEEFKDRQFNCCKIKDKVIKIMEKCFEHWQYIGGEINIGVYQDAPRFL